MKLEVTLFRSGLYTHVGDAAKTHVLEKKPGLAKNISELKGEAYRAELRDWRTNQELHGCTGLACDTSPRIVQKSARSKFLTSTKTDHTKVPTDESHNPHLDLGSIIGSLDMLGFMVSAHDLSKTSSFFFILCTLKKKTTSTYNL